jgi:hypothetical protein
MSVDQLRRIIADVARHSADRSIATTRAELTARLQEAGIAIPSESWLDALSREAVHGRAYVLDTEGSETDQKDDPALARALGEAPANLDIEVPLARRPTWFPVGDPEPTPPGLARTTLVARIKRHLQATGSLATARIAVVVVTLVAISAWRWQRRRSNASPNDNDARRSD